MAEFINKAVLEDKQRELYVAHKEASEKKGHTTTELNRHLGQIASDAEVRGETDITVNHTGPVYDAYRDAVSRDAWVMMDQAARKTREFAAAREGYGKSIREGRRHYRENEGAYVEQAIGEMEAADIPYEPGPQNITEQSQSPK